MTIHLAIRGFAGKKRVFEDLVEIDVNQMEGVIPGLALKHADALAAHELHMIEIEFLDDPNQEERFLRFGTDPRGMVRPIAISGGYYS